MASSTRNRLVVQAMAVAALCIYAAVALRFPPAASTPERGVVRFVAGDLAFSKGAAQAPSVFRTVRLDGRNLLDFRPETQAGGSIAWLRFRFERASLPDGPIALYCPRLRQRSSLYINGRLFLRDIVHGDQAVLNWNRPVFTELPAELLRGGSNEIVFRLNPSPHAEASAAPIRIGAYDALRRAYEQRLGLQIVLPRAINGVIALLTLGVFLLWLARPKKSVYGWLAAIGALWFARNLHYSVDYPPFDAALFWNLSLDVLFPLTIALYGFSASYFRWPHRGRIVTALCAAALALLVLSHAPFIAKGDPFAAVVAVSIPASLLVTGALAREVLRAPTWPGALTAAAMVAALILSANDLLLMLHLLPDEWFYLQPYASIVVFSAFGFAVARRVVDSLRAFERSNAVLEQRVDEAHGALAASEVERRRLEVANAIKEGRERVMREMHDGVGANLVTALAAARLHGGSSRTIDALAHCLTDLKLTVDSLAPFEGDVAALLASLRYRIEPQLRDAGLTLDWRVEPVSRLVWLNATRGLYLLRIVQEALANVVTHARAADVSVIAQNAVRDGAEGVRIAIIDDGLGFSAAANNGGEGLSVMRSRARAIGATLAISPGRTRGVEVEIWLPIRGGT